MLGLYLTDHQVELVKRIQPHFGKNIVEDVTSGRWYPCAFLAILGDKFLRLKDTQNDFLEFDIYGQTTNDIHPMKIGSQRGRVDDLFLGRFLLYDDSEDGGWVLMSLQRNVTDYLLTCLSSDEDPDKLFQGLQSQISYKKLSGIRLKRRYGDGHLLFQRRMEDDWITVTFQEWIMWLATDETVTLTSS